MAIFRDMEHSGYWTSFFYGLTIITQCVSRDDEGVEMLKYLRPTSMGLALTVTFLLLNLSSAEAFGQKVRETVVYSPPSLSLTANPTMTTVCDGAEAAPSISLAAQASSPDGNPIRYSWRVTGGRINGNGANVTWDLSGAQPGYHKAYVEIDTGKGDELCQAFASTSIFVKRCSPPAPVCPTVRISCPNNAIAGQPLDFTADVTGGSPDIPRVFNWTISSGTIMSGQSTSSLRVDTSGLEGQTVRATLSIGGYPMECSASCVVPFPIPLECRKFDEFPELARNDEKARLDNFAIDLQRDPSSTAYVIVYPGQTNRAGKVQQHTARIVDYLINSRGLDARRVVTLVGRERAELLVELWTCPQGGKPPTVK